MMIDLILGWGFFFGGQVEGNGNEVAGWCFWTTRTPEASVASPNEAIWTPQHEHVPNSQLRVLRVVNGNGGYGEVSDMSLGVRVG